MNVLFLKDYQEIQLGILRTRINQAVTNASSYVYLEIAQNVSDMYNKSLMVADSRCLLKVTQLDTYSYSALITDPLITNFEFS